MPAGRPGRIGHDCAGPAGRSGLRPPRYPRYSRRARSVPDAYSWAREGLPRSRHAGAAEPRPPHAAPTARPGRSVGCGEIRYRVLPPGCAAWMTNSTWCGWTAETSSRTLHGRLLVLSPADPARRARPGPASARRAGSSRCKPGRPPRPRLRRLRACPAWSARTLARRGSARRAPLQPALRPGNGMGTPASIGRSSAGAARPPRPAAPAVTSRRRAGPAHQKRAPCGPAQQPWRLLLYG